MYEVGPLPRRDNQFNLAPADAFTEGIPGVRDRGWLRGVSTSAVVLRSGQTLGVTQSDDLCAAVVTSKAEGLDLQHSRGVAAAELVCPTRGVLDPQYLDHLRRLLLNRVLGATVEAWTPTGGTSNEIIAEAEGELDSLIGFTGMIGVPADKLAMASGLKYLDDGVYSPSGHQLYIRPKGAGWSVTSDVFYEWHAEISTIFEQQQNIQRYSVVVYALTAYDTKPSALLL